MPLVSDLPATGEHSISQSGPVELIRGARSLRSAIAFELKSNMQVLP